ncbi:flagellar biosynthesis-like protein (FlhF) [Alkalicaulis satelles]|uniref:Flagellar biosynthesis-like protein (FlhF) n=1 Tax=Alkalicaulis satelles TaxID=2609175 RepID=A0A5M6ZBQ5_9PROT|nr:flagellar biosynthesis-like protein (FlhF) [Alkalicaulis satelles]KAA5802173.1 flagellar biosynthesis-like protein (FlhF) [Alkalicaulis satelles]
MRMRTFTGDSLSAVMADVRRTLGPDAVIITSGDAPGGGVEVRAAAERGAISAPAEDSATALARRDAARTRARGDSSAGLTRIARALDWHQVPGQAGKHLLDAAMAMEDGEATATLARALDQRYGVHPVEPDPGRAILLAGAPGSGKSSCAARLAARACAQGVRPRLISADAKAGAREQLAAYAAALELEYEAVDGPRELSAVLARPGPDPVIIDAPGVNAFELDDLDDLADLAYAADAELIAVIEAGLAPGDAEDACALFAAIGAGRAIVTKLDAARRRGALLAPGEAGLAYAHISASPFIGSGLAPATALRLARALLEDDAGAEDGS